MNGRVALAALTVVLSGCVHTPGENLAAPEPAVKHPYHAGIYYGLVFREAAHRDHTGHGNSLRIGPASVAMFDQVLPRVFAKTSPLSSLSAEETRSKKVDLIVVPTLESYDFYPTRISSGSRLVYRVTLLGKDGAPGRSWLIPVRAGWDGVRSDDPRRLREVADVTMAAAARQLVRSFDERAGDITHASGSHAMVPNPPAQAQVAAALTALSSGADEPLARAKVFPVRVSVKSLHERNLVIRSSDMSLRFEDGRAFEEMPVSQVISLVETTRPAPKKREPTEAESSARFAQGLLHVLSGGFVPPPLDHETPTERRARMDAFGANRAPIAQQTGHSQFGEREIVPTAATEGIVYFRLQRGMPKSGGVLTVWVIDADSGAATSIQTPLGSAPH